MHKRNEQWWNRCKNTYGIYLNNKASKIIEFGSYNINGSLRDMFACHEFYLGIDWRPQTRYVDIVSLAHELKLDQKFDAVISASMLEHDPYWEKSLANMLSYMKDDGIMILSWGAALNAPHCLAEAPDGHFHSLKAGSVINKLRELGMYIHEFWYEGLLYPDPQNTYATGMGEVALLAFKDAKYARGEQTINELLPEDRA